MLFIEQFMFNMGVFARGVGFETKQFFVTNIAQNINQLAMVPSSSAHASAQNSLEFLDNRPRNGESARRSG